MHDPRGAVPPYLSLVIPTRNDSYPSNIPAIQGTSLAILRRQLEDARIESEILVVEYNPAPSQPRLSETLRAFASGESKFVTTRVMTVDPREHRRFRHSNERVFHQTLAVNIGLRRSRGRFVVYRAADHIYSDALIDFLAGQTLHDDTIYRCHRVDVSRAAFEEIVPGDPASVICDRHTIRRYQQIAYEPSWRIPTLHTEACGDFMLMSRDLWMRIAGLHESKLPLFLDYDSVAFHAAFALTRSETILPNECCVYKLDHSLKSAERLQQSWSPGWQRLDRAMMRAGTGWANLARAIFNYPRRVDRTFPSARLDSLERHFVLPAFLYAHGFPVRRQNFGRWGVAGATLEEATLTRAEWDHD
jgi:hypothetical protein